MERVFDGKKWERVHSGKECEKIYDWKECDGNVISRGERTVR